MSVLVLVSIVIWSRALRKLPANIHFVIYIASVFGCHTAETINA